VPGEHPFGRKGKEEKPPKFLRKKKNANSFAEESVEKGDPAGDDGATEDNEEVGRNPPGSSIHHSGPTAVGNRAAEGCQKEVG